MTPAEFRDAVLAEWKASPEDSMGPSLDRVLARMLEQAESRGFWRGVCIGFGEGVHAGTYGATEDDGCNCVGCEELRGVVAQLHRWAEKG